MLPSLTTEYFNQHLLVTRVPVVRRNKSATVCGMRETKGNPVKIRCGRATVIGETSSCEHPFETGCLRKPLSAPCGWEGGEPSLSAISQEACLRVVLAALRGMSEADLPVNRACLTNAAECPPNTPRPPSADGVFLSSCFLFSFGSLPRTAGATRVPPHSNGRAGRCGTAVFSCDSQKKVLRGRI